MGIVCYVYTVRYCSFLLFSYFVCLLFTCCYLIGWIKINIIYRVFEILQHYIVCRLLYVPVKLITLLKSLLTGVIHTMSDSVLAFLVSLLPFRHLLLLEYLSIRLSVCLSICHTRASRLHDSTYRNILCTVA